MYKGLFAVLMTICLLGMSVTVSAEDDIRIGMIGLDTSHVIAFTKILNDTENASYIPGAKVVAAAANDLLDSLPAPGNGMSCELGSLSFSSSSRLT